MFVKDEGKGISKEMLDKMGTSFMTTKENGTGLLKERTVMGGIL